MAGRRKGKGIVMVTILRSHGRTNRGGEQQEEGAKGSLKPKASLALVGIMVLASSVPHPSHQHPTPPTASVTHSMQVTRKFLDAYNAHNLTGVLATLAADIDYGDCDYRYKISRVMHGKGSVAIWLRARFAEHDRLLHGTISVPDGARLPQAVAIFGMTRTNDTLKAQHRSVVIAAKIGLTHNERFLEALRMGGNSC